MRRFALAPLLVLGSLACGDDAAPSPDAPPPPPDAPAPDAAPVEPDAAAPPLPTPADIQFAAVSPLPAGAQIVFNDWNPSPNAVRSLSLEDGTVTEVFRAYRVWSLGVARAGDRVAFACGDREQQAHYGITIGDAIQHTWLYDVATATAAPLAVGNLNDECHRFGPDDRFLYVCRRYDFDASGVPRAWRTGRIDLTTGAFAFLAPESPLDYYLHPGPTADEAVLYYDVIHIETSPFSQHRRVERRALPDGEPELVLDDATSPALSPDGTRLAYVAWSGTFDLRVARLDGSEDVKVATGVSRPTFSPDGARLAFLLDDDAAGCAHIATAAADGSEVDAPTVVRDCVASGEFITALEWIDRR